MKCNLPADFMSVLSTGRIVYVFGAGMSSALSGRRSGWAQLITDGIGYIDDAALADSLRQRLAADASAASLVDVIGEVIAETRKNHTYDAWMQASIESLTVTNASLAESLRLIRAPGDIITTTNYDSLLEATTGLKALDYEQPDAAFHMIDQDRADRVFHLHGRYDSANHIDNIIASKEQYEKIYNDEAAQFIQNFLGTRTLVFIGCGQTTEDVNISRFIAFAAEKLHLDQPCFFIKRSGETVSGLPANFVTVDYGSDYADLPDFLDDMLTYCAAQFMNHNPIVGRTAWNTVAPAAFANYHFTGQEIGFVGRSQELAALTAFVEAADKLSWWAITGQAGAGKSRLALELMGRTGWYSFFLNDRATLEQANSFTPFCDTLIVIDYVQGREQVIAQIIAALRKSYYASRFRLRLLLLERNNDDGYGSWYKNLVSALGAMDTANFEKSRFPGAESLFLELGDLDEAAIEDFIGEICSLHDLPADALRNRKLRIAYGEKFEILRYRPLFIRLYVEAWIDNKCTAPRYDSFDGILEAVVQKEQTRWLELLGNDASLCASLIRLVMRAAAGGGIKPDRIPPLYAGDWERLREYIKENTLPGRQRDDSIQSIMADVMQNIQTNHGFWNPQYPDIIKEFMFAYYAADDVLDLAAELWANAGEEFSRFMFRSLCDFRDNPVFIVIIEQAPEPYSDANILDARRAFLTKTVVYPHETPESLVSRIDREYSFWSGMPYVENTCNAEEYRLATVKMAGLKGVADQYGALMQLDKMVRCIDEVLTMKGQGFEIFQALMLEERMKTCAIWNQPQLSRRFADQLMEMVGRTMGDSSDASVNRMFQLLEANNRMMAALLANKFGEALSILQAEHRGGDLSDETQAGLFAHMACNMVEIAANKRKEKYLIRGCAYLDRCMEARPEDSQVLVKYYHAQAKRLQYYYFEKNLGNKDEVVSLLNEIEQSGCDSQGETWGFTAIFLLNFITEDDPILDRLLDKAEAYLEADENDFAANVWIMLQRFIYSQRKQAVPKEIVEKAHAWFLRVPESESTRESFLRLLDSSTEKNNKDKYITKRIKDAMIQDAMHNPLYAEDAQEQLLRLGGVERLAGNYLDDEPGDGEASTYVREHKKTGLNQPCPCGSGKKFKKCCRGNGKYD